MKKIILLLLLLTALSSTAFASPPPKEQVESELLTLINHHIDGYKDNPRVMICQILGYESQNVKDGWRKSKCIITGDYSYEIQQTNSVDSPYTAYFIYKMFILVSPPYSTREDAERTEVFKENNRPNVYRISLSYQDGKWTPIKYESQFQVERNIPPFWRAMEQNISNTAYKRVVVIK